MSPLVISASGVRGVVGDGLTPEVVINLVSAFGSAREGKILVGYDTRSSNNMFKYAVFSALLSVGCEAVDGGICSTPSLQLLVKERGYRGGVMITGSHNPVEWNALKFVRDDGLFLFPEEGEELVELYRRSDFPRAAWNTLGCVSQDGSAIENHIRKIIPLIEVEDIRRRKFKVVVDACNGAGSVITPLLLERLGCEVVKVNCLTNGIFPHPPEPRSSHLSQLCQVVKDSEADVGFAHDADADRLALVSERGEAISEEYTLVLATSFILQRLRGPVVTNACTSQAVEDVAGKFGCPVRRTKVGDVYVSRLMRECGAVIGGEGNGGVIFPLINYARDGVTAVALILNYMANEDTPVSSIIEKMPRYCMFKEKIDISEIDFHRLIENIPHEFDSSQLDFTDGVKIRLEGGWVHMRPSGTEPILRLVGEGKDPRMAKRISNWALQFISKFSRGEK